MKTLITAARKALKKAYAPYSKFRVGAALETSSGKVFTGCNVENLSFGLTVCAERVAVFKAVSEGHTSFKRIAIASDDPEAITPCGACRQVLAEFCEELEIICAPRSGNPVVYWLSELLPLGTSIKKLDKK